MATTLSIFPKRDQKRFDDVPSFSLEERLGYFSPSYDELSIIKNLKTPTSKIGFILQFGYFKSQGKFFTPNQFKKYDIAFVARSLGYPKSQFEDYSRPLVSRHRKEILKHQDWLAFDKNQKEKLIAHINWAIPNQIVPKKVFLSAIDFCWANRIEVPSYSTLSTLITDPYNIFERGLEKKLSKTLTNHHHHKIQELLSPSKPFTLLKKISQSTRPMDIKSSVEDFKLFYAYFNDFKDSIEALNLSDQSTEYFGTWVQKSLTSQLTRMDDSKMELYVLAYIKNRLYIRNDFLVDTFLKVVQSTVNKAHRNLNALEKKLRTERNKSINKISGHQQEAHSSLLSIKETLKGPLNDQEKLNNIKEITDAYSVRQEDVDILTKSLEKTNTTHILYDALESLSSSLQRKTNPILKVLKFNPVNSDEKILKALDHFVATDGNIGNKPPISFIKSDLRSMLYKGNKLRTSLYKCLLCLYIAKGIKSGQLNLQYSYRYRSIDEYLIDRPTFEVNKDQLLKSADLWQFKDFSATMKKLEEDIEEKYKIVNETFNPHLKRSAKGNLHILTPKTSDTHKEYVSSLLSSAGYVPIIQILRNINNLTQFTEAFEHFSIKHKKMNPTPMTLLAGLIGKGCNIGVRKIANISTGIGEDKLKNVVKWFFSLKNLKKAINRILSITNKLALADLYRHSKEELHTGSDGCKMNVRPDSLFGSYSYKYFGKGKGVSIYTFLDERNLLFHSTVISASEREAAYVIDGLLQNDVLQSTIHSTDTHGFTEMVFAGMHFISVSFAPRIKNVTHQRLYSFKSKKTYDKKGYAILPYAKIKSKLIERNWDNILRFMATIKLKHTSASQLFKRLSSYAKENPLYQAIREFGRIIKTSFILTYFNDTVLRQRIEKQLNRVELSNKFSRAVFFANNQEFKCATKEEQEIATACKVLIQNAIILWNYLYISQLLANNNDEADRKEMIKFLKKSSMIAWQHVNFHGEYDFIKYAANTNIPFDLKSIMNLKVS